MKKPIVLLAIGAALVALAVVPTTPPPGRVRVAWSYPPAELTTNITFVLYHSTNASAPVTSWPVLTNVPGTTNAVVLTVAPGVHLFTVTASNRFGESLPSNVAVMQLARAATNATIEPEP